MAPSAIDEAHTPSKKSEKKHKREKSEHKKKRSRDEDDSAAVETTPREYKRSKSEVPVDHDASDNDNAALEATSPSKKKKSKKEKPAKEEATELATDDEARKERKKAKKAKKHQEEEQDDAEIDPAEQSLKKYSSIKREKGEGKKSKKDRKKQEAADEDMMDVDTAEVQFDTEAKEKKKRKKEKSKDKKKRVASPEPEAEANAMDIDMGDLSIRTKTKVPDIPADPSFPFFKQTTSIYVPFFPVGFDKPLTNAAAQHLEPLLNHYSPLLKGVLLKYSNLHLSDKPRQGDPKNPSTDETPALLYSKDEYAVGFVWLTFDAYLFKPSRGKWMEGVLQLQSEGHIGVVCWDKFNASIEAKRLPKGWKWVDEAKKDTANGSGSGSIPSPAWDTEVAEDKLSESDNLDGEELQVVEQMHSTGYWVNEQGRKITDKLRFRIKNFDVGLAGDYGYLSIEGTFLDDEAERALMAEERENERRRRLRQNPNGLLRPLAKRVPEFSVTKFGKEEQEEDSGQRTVYDKGSRPGTPDN